METNARNAHNQLIGANKIKIASNVPLEESINLVPSNVNVKEIIFGLERNVSNVSIHNILT